MKKGDAQHLLVNLLSDMLISEHDSMLAFLESRPTSELDKAAKALAWLRKIGPELTVRRQLRRREAALAMSVADMNRNSFESEGQARRNGHGDALWIDVSGVYTDRAEVTFEEFRSTCRMMGKSLPTLTPGPGGSLVSATTGATILVPVLGKIGAGS